MKEPSSEPIRPEWVPAGADPGKFTTSILSGTQHPSASARSPGARGGRPPPDPEWLSEGVLAGDRVRLARAITLVESRAPAHQKAAQVVLQNCLPHSGGSRRIGISGVPGSGKSTFIEAFGMHEIKEGRKIAVLAIDPSSTRTGGSVLGDKTRMETLARESNAFIRPSPTGGTLGGVASRTRESMVLVEAAGFDTVVVETVGVGQSEVTLRSMVDFFLLLQLAGAGDDLQGIKRGIMEIADAIAVNKAEGANRKRSEVAAGEFRRIFHYLLPYSEGWEPEVLLCSALTGDGIAEAAKTIERFLEQMRENGHLQRERKRQNAAWFETLVEEEILKVFFRNEDRRKAVIELKGQVEEEHIPVSVAIDRVRALLQD